MSGKRKTEYEGSVSATLRPETAWLAGVLADALGQDRTKVLADAAILYAGQLKRAKRVKLSKGNTC